jgi:UDP-glucose 4-epimerase
MQDLPVAKPHILVTGGAGYIGSHTVHLLLGQGCEVTVVDNLSKGYRHNVPAERLCELDLADTDALTRLLRDRRPDAVIHFAAFIAVGESMREPAKYFANNTGGSLSLCTAMVAAGVRHLVFSSTAAVYGTPHAVPILETFPIQPVSPYGESKVMAETLLRWFDRIHGLRSVSLRYFNAAGADPGGCIGEEHEPETHLIPLVLRAAATGQPVTVFGEDYDTPDGTCIRDYIHVSDLAQAHIQAVEYLTGGGPSQAFNAGTGRGYSVREIMRAAEEVTGRKVPYAAGARRDGDPPSLVADAGRLRRTLGWEPRYTDIRTVIEHAWNFARR